MTCVWRDNVNRCLAALFGVLLLLGSGTIARAELLVYEGFDYTPGASIDGLSGGGSFGWDGAWGNVGFDVGTSSEIQASSLSYTDGLGNVLTTTGGSLLNSGDDGTSGQPGRLLETRRGVPEHVGTSTWISFVGQRTGGMEDSAGSDVFVRGANLSLFDTTAFAAEKLNLGHNSNSWYPVVDEEGMEIARESRWQIRAPRVPNALLHIDPKPTPNPPTGNAARLKDVYTEAFLEDVTLVLVRIDHLDHISQQDDVWIWTNPNLDEEPDTANASAWFNADEMQQSADELFALPYDTADNGGFSFNMIRYFAGNQGSAQFPAEWLTDEIRIGTTFAAVTPHTSGGGPDGDFNGDGVIDAADYTAWRDMGGTAQQYEDWRGNFGAGQGSSSGLASVASVPEPGALVFTLVAAAVGLCVRRRSRGF